MALTVPENPKVYTTKYADFKGVDFTNDPSNVWYRRSPDAVNMLPDESGKPFKRTGWEIAVPASQMAELYATDNGTPAPSEVTVNKCHYFELAGEDHIIIFTNIGVFFYRDGVLASSKSLDHTNFISYDQDMIESYDRSFFFEGGGKSAFYSYGGFKIWEYAYDDTNGFTWQEVQPYIPRVNIGVDARHESGTAYEEVNMLSDFICEEFQDNVFYEITSKSISIVGAVVNVDVNIFTSVITMPQDFTGYPATYQFIYSTADHSWLLGGDQVLLSYYGISTNANPVDGTTITVVLDYVKRINLPKKILNIDGMEVWVSDSIQFDKELVLEEDTPSKHTGADYCTLVTPQAGNSYIVFYKEWLPLVVGEDAIRVVYPRNAITAVTHGTSDAIEVSVGAI